MSIKCTPCKIISGIIAIAVMIALVWSSVRYVNYDEMALLRTKLSGVVHYDDNDPVSSTGRFWDGLIYASQVYPITYQKLEYDDLMVFSKLQIQYTMSAVFYYKVEPTVFKKIYRFYRDNHQTQVNNSVVTSTKNTMFNYTLDEVISNRTRIISELCDHVNYGLNSGTNPLFVTIPCDKVFITKIDFPPIIENSFLNKALQLVKAREADLGKQIAQINIDTINMIEQINAQINVISQITDSQSNKIINDANNQAIKMKLDVVNQGFNELLHLLNITDVSTIQKLNRLLILMDKTNDMKIMDVETPTGTTVILK